mmetsp:Transcript_49336/g.127272  ORF Transcript_49336/g.127272 Transcript_49336/m.127272 type:complete len:357 (-) Transcript_49336:309-1379(-)
MDRHLARLVAVTAAAAPAAAWLWHRRQQRALLAAAGQLGEEAAAADGLTLAAASEEVVRLLSERQPKQLESVLPSLHYLPPYIPKDSPQGGVTWTTLGNLVTAAERNLPASGRVEGHRWISLRLDGTGFSKVVRRLRSNGFLEPGFSSDFATIMQECSRGLMEEFHAKVSFTHSDEMTVIIPPASIVRGEQQPHLRGGRVIKLCTVAAGLVTALFNAKVARLCIDKGIKPDDFILSHFDCRMASYATWEEARAVLLWRAYDCSVNGVSDAVHHTKGAGTKVKSLNTGQKLRWLAEQGLLPLAPHQAFGTYLVKAHRVIDAVNPKTGQPVQAVRGVIERLGGSVLELARQGRMLPAA